MTRIEKSLFVLCGVLLILFIILVFLVGDTFTRVLFFLLAAAMILLIVRMLDWLCKTRKICLKSVFQKDGAPDAALSTDDSSEPSAASCDVDGQEVPCGLQEEDSADEDVGWDDAEEETGETNEDDTDSDKQKEETDDSHADVQTLREGPDDSASDLREEPQSAPDEADSDSPSSSSARAMPSEPSPAEPEPRYIGHAQNLRFHLPNCPTLPSMKNRVPLESREEALAHGYTPCSNCKP